MLCQRLTIIHFLDQGLLLCPRGRHNVGFQLPFGPIEVHHKCCWFVHLQITTGICEYEYTDTGTQTQPNTHPDRHTQSQQHTLAFS